MPIEPGESVDSLRNMMNSPAARGRTIRFVVDALDLSGYTTAFQDKVRSGQLPLLMNSSEWVPPYSMLAN